MANLNETATWEAGIYQWETSDPVQGGPNGIDNKPTRQLANRTLWLKNEIAKSVQSIGQNKNEAAQLYALKTTSLTAGAGLTGGGVFRDNMTLALGTPGTCSGSTTNWAGSDTHTHQLADASPTVAGVAKLINNLTTDDANSALSAAMGRKLAEEKIPNTTQDFMRTLGEFNPGKSGFVRTNGGSLNGNSLPSMEIHVGHPSYANGAYSRGIGFAYGTGWGIYTTAWDATGNYRGYKEILTEENGVMLTGNQTVGGKKTFSESTDFAGGLRISGNNTEQWSGFYRGNADWYWNNPIAGKALQFNDDGTLALSGDKILLYTHRSNAVNLDRDDKIATSKAVKIVNDKIEQAAPSGEIAYFAGRNAPAGWLKANGAAVSRTTYADLFAAIGTTYGAGDGRTTFNLPDVRGEFVRGWDDGRNIDRGRVVGSAQNQSMADHYHGIGIMNTTDDILIVNKNWSGGGNEYPVMEMAGEYNKVLKGRISSTRLIDGGALNDGGRAYAPGNGSAFHAERVHHIATAMQDSSGNSSETRPRNVALLACIKI